MSGKTNPSTNPPEHGEDHNRRQRRERITWFVVLQLTMLLYATTSIFSKNASRYKTASWQFILCYAGMLTVLGLYAVLWQQIMKHLPLTLAYANKGVNIIWGLVFGAALFREKIRPVQLAGCALIIFGTVLYMRADQAEQAAEGETMSGQAKAGEEHI